VSTRAAALPGTARRSRPAAPAAAGAGGRVAHPFFVFMLGIIPLLSVSAAARGDTSAVYTVGSQIPPLAFVVPLWALAVALTWKAGWDLRLPRFLTFLLAIWAYGALASLVQFPLGLKLVIGRFVFIALIFMAFSVLRTRHDVRRFEAVFLAAMAVVALLTLVQAFGLVHLPFGDRIRGRQMFSFLPARTLGVPMSYGEHGILLSMGFAILFARLFGRTGHRQRGRIVLWGVLGMYLLALLISQSRGSLVGFAVMVTMYAVVGRVTGVLDARGRMVAFAGVVAMLWAVAVVDWSLVLQDVVSVNSQTVDQRGRQMEFALQLLRESPLLGVGYGGFFIRYSAAGGSEALHNAFLHEYVSAGIVVGTVYVGLFLWTGWALLRTASNARVPLGVRTYAVALLSAFGFAVAQLNVFQGFYVEILAVMFALAARLSRISTDTLRQGGVPPRPS
jgi:O-antigen ligase